MRVKGATAVIKLLEEFGVEYIFGYPGGANLPLYDALNKSKRIKHILVRHEQGAAFMAIGYAKIKRFPGVCFATSGPGVTNLLTGLADAYLDSVPIVAITGQIPREFIGTDAFQEVDTFNITAPITKSNELINDIDELQPAIKSAFYICSTGRFGPVLVDIPRDIQEAKVNFDANVERELPGFQPTLKPHIGQIKRAVRAFNRSKCPLAIIGGGVIQAGAKNLLLDFITKSGIQVVRTLLAKSTMLEGHPAYVGMIGTHGNSAANQAISQADFILAIGTRFSDRSTSFKKDNFVKHAIVAHLDIDPAEIGKSVPVDIPMVGDINVALEMLNREITNQKIKPRLSWFKKNTTENILWKGEAADTIELVLNELNKLDFEFHITTDVGRHQMWATHCCNNPAHWPLLTSGGLGSMGFGLPAAIGCWFADNSKPVVNISGDGSFFMNMQEFVTAVEYNIPVVVLIINDYRLGMIHENQAVLYGNRSFANKFKAVYDFVALAKSFGGHGYKVTDLAQVKPALVNAITKRRPAIIDVDLYKVASARNLKLKAVS